MVRLVYASAATVPFSAADLAALLAVARKNNVGLGVTGVLLFHEGSFLQVLEGDQGAVEPLLEKIHRDVRHDRLFVLGRFEVEERAFAEWSMGSLELSALRGQTLEGLNDFLRVGAPGLHVGESLVQRVLEGFRDGRYRRYVR